MREDVVKGQERARVTCVYLDIHLLTVCLLYKYSVIFLKDKI